jgi:hypothetical protein
MEERRRLQMSISGLVVTVDTLATGFSTHLRPLLLLLQIRTQPFLCCCLAAATAAASAIFMHLRTNSATPYTSQLHMRSCNDVNGNCADRRSRLTTAVAGHEKRVHSPRVRVLEIAVLPCRQDLDRARHDDRLTTAVAEHEREDELRHPQEGRAFPKLHIACSHVQTKPLLDACQVPPPSCGY